MFVDCFLDGSKEYQTIRKEEKMKTKKFNKKLGLKKETISTLVAEAIPISHEEKGKLKGGITGTWCSQYYSCDEWCFSFNTKC